MECVHCGSKEYWKNGKHQGVQRYRCKVCKRYFSDRPKKFTYADKRRAMEYYMNNCGIRKTARFMGCSPYMIILWIREFAEQVRMEQARSQAEESTGGDIIEMDEIYTMVKKTSEGGSMDGLLKDEG